MDKISKAIAAGIGGGATGAATSIYALPEGSPWEAYVLMALISTVVPAVLTYLAPKNAD